MLTLRSTFFTILFPGTATVFVPYFIVSDTGRVVIAPLSWFGVLPIFAGAVVLFRCIWDFAVVGQGTLAPVDPPKQLVVRGLYHYVRNPMYVAVLLILLGEAILFASVTMIIYAAGFFVFAHLFITLYEEPTLRLQFGDSYELYSRTVHRWFPRRPAG